MIVRFIKPVMLTCLLAGLLAGCSVSEKAEVQTLFGYALGTSYSVKLVSTLPEARSLQLGIDGVLADVNEHMSTYLPRSDLSLFATADVGVPVDVSEKTAFVVAQALQIAGATDGNFDPTVAPIVDLWGFGPTPRNATRPSDDEIDRLLAETGYQAVEVLSERQLVKRAPRELDLSAIAKGYAVDLIADYILAEGYDSFLVEVGGEMRFSGQKPGNQPWKIAVEKPEAGTREPYRLMTIREGAVATSGDYRNYFEIDGVRYSHTINPITGYPVEHDLASVTVVMDKCLQADAYATAFMVMGRERALAFAEQHDIAVLLIYKSEGEFKSVQSAAFTARFGQANTPS